MASSESGKLVYLERSRRRVSSRRARSRRPPQVVPDKESRWLGIGLFAGAGAMALSWLIAGPEGSASGGSAVAALLVIVLAVVAGRRLRSGHPGASLVPALLASGSLLYLGLDRLTSGILAAASGDLSLAERTDVLVSAFCLSIGVWTVSHFLRVLGERQGDRR